MDSKAESLKEKIQKNRWLYALDGIIGGIVNGLPMVLFSAVLYAARRLFDACVFGVMLYVVLTAVLFPEGCKREADSRALRGEAAVVQLGKAYGQADTLVGVEKIPGNSK